jgi:glycerate kinase
MMPILIAPNAFKNSLDATAVAEAIAEGLRQSQLNCSLECFPVGDGGDGTATLIIRKYNGTAVSAEVRDPLGRKIQSSFGLIHTSEIAVIELADASGLRLLKANELDPLHATTHGVGELIKHALDKEVKAILMCIGGSATVDGGIGILQALGIRFLDKNNEVFNCVPENMVNMESMNCALFDSRIWNCEFIILCDVENRLLGEDGAAKIFGPQKGASVEDVKKLEEGLTKFSQITLGQLGLDMTALKYGGAAGGVAAGLSVFCNAKLVSGIDYFLDLTGFDEALQRAALVITGEGSIDVQTLRGKGPYGVALRAKQQDASVIALGGTVPDMEDDEMRKYFDVMVPINFEPVDLATAIKNTRKDLVRTAKGIGDFLDKELMPTMEL